MPPVIPIITGALAAGGTIGNLFGANKQQKASDQLLGAQTGELNWMQQYQKYLQSLTPADISKMVDQATQPLNQNLTQSVNTPIQASLAEKGLGQAPGIQAQEEATALAPFQQQNQQTGLAEIMQLLGLPLEAGNSVLSGSQGGGSLLPGQTNNSGAWQAFLQSLQKKPNTATPSATAGSTPQGIIFDSPTSGSGSGDTFNAYTGMAA